MDTVIITINSNPLDISGIDEKVNVLELVNLVEESLKGSGATVMRVVLDGKEYSAEDTEKLENMKLIDYETADVISETAADVIQDAFCDSPEILFHLEDVEPVMLMN